MTEILDAKIGKNSVFHVFFGVILFPNFDMVKGWLPDDDFTPLFSAKLSQVCF